MEAEELGEEYQKVEYPVLYYHKATGYYYDPVRMGSYRVAKWEKLPLTC